MTFNTHFIPVGFTALTGQVLLLGLLEVPVAGWLVGLGITVITLMLLDTALRRRHQLRLGPADWVTLNRLVLVAGVAALLATGGPMGPVTAITAVALALDGVDGQVARRTGTASSLGARFDMEVDAFLILVLSLEVASRLGWWVVALGAARYVFVAAAWLVPWMAQPLAYRYWRKVVAAAVGIALLVVVADVLPVPAELVITGVALLMLAESFGRDVVYLWARRPLAAEVPA